MNNTIKFKSKKYKKNITAVLHRYDIMFKIEEKPGLERCIDLLLPTNTNDYDFTVLMEELNMALPDNLAVGITNGIPTYYKRK